ncbi:MAG: amino acid carrier protein [Puniceicoccales bacterium]|nr:amino acid carrier protein [Puniceicoccales bacterium]
MVDTFLRYLVLFLVLPALLGASVYFSLRLRWPQLRCLGEGWRRMFADKTKGGKMSNFAAVATIVGGNLGAGTIAGTALAIAVGGPGSIFWMAAVAVLGSVVKLACASLGVLYQTKQHHGRCIGGPMFYILNGVGSYPLSIFYCIFIVGASLSVGNLVQVNVFTSSFQSCSVLAKMACALIFMIPAVIILSGGLKRFAAFMSCSIPIVGIVYIVACLVGIVMLRHQLGSAIGRIFCGAFSLNAVGGGSVGILFSQTLQAGISRGLFATDIGLGLAAIAHGNVDSSDLPIAQHAREQGLIALLAPILVAILCAITGILILCSNPDLSNGASQICIDTFAIAFGTRYAGWFIPVIIYCFALTTILGWAWFAEHTFFFLRRSHWRYYYRAIFLAMIFVGAFMRTSLPWIIADVCIDGLLLSNLFAIFYLRRKIVSTYGDEGQQMVGRQGLEP